MSKTKTFVSWSLKNFPLAVLSFLFISIALVASAMAFMGFIESKFPAYVVPGVLVARAEKSDMPVRLYVLNEVYKAGLDVDAIDNMIGDCENRGWNTEASYINYNNRAGIDRGLWMINSISHKEVSNACAYDLACSTKEAIRIIKKRGLKEWTCGK